LNVAGRNLEEDSLGSQAGSNLKRRKGKEKVDHFFADRKGGTVTLRDSSRGKVLKSESLIQGKKIGGL